MVIRISKRDIMVFVCAFAGILSMNPYFVWRTYAGGLLTYAVYALDAISIFCFICLSGNLMKINMKKLILIFLLVSLYVITYVNSYTELNVKTLVAGCVMFTYLYFFAAASNDVKKEVFELFVKIFVVSMIPGIIYYVLEVVGVSLSMGVLYSTNQLNYQKSLEFQYITHPDYYKHYLGAVMRVSSNTRMSGIYDEPGLVGTVASLLLIARDFSLKKKWENIFLLVILIMSFSMAGYILAIFYFGMKWLKEKQYKLVVYGCIALIGFVFFLNLDTSNSTIINFQKRFQISETGINIVNNRLTSKYMTGFSEFTNGDFMIRMFGFGKGAATYNEYMAGSSSYLDMIYNYGYLGFGLMVFTIIFIYIRDSRKNIRLYWKEIIMLSAFLLSMYQRPGVYMPFYFIILYGGQAYIRGRQNDASY